jgi:hypothetical protein
MFEKKRFLAEAQPYYANPDSEIIASREFPSMYVAVISTYISPSLVSYCLEMNECPSWACTGTLKYVTFNYDLKHKKFLTPEDIIQTQAKEVFRLLSSKCGCFDLYYHTHAHGRLRLNDFQVNVDKNNVVFNFPAIEIGSGCETREMISRKQLSIKIDGEKKDASYTSCTAPNNGNQRRSIIVYHGSRSTPHTLYQEEASVRCDTGAARRR